MSVPLLVWVGVVAGLAALLLVDLLVVGRRPHEFGLRESAAWYAGYVGIAVAFGLALLTWQGAGVAGQYFAGYLVEESLSIDNLFVFVLILTSFAVPAAQQPKALLLGVIGALMLRAGFIAGGLALLDRLHWVVYVFGAVLVLTGLRLARSGHPEPDLARNPVLRLTRRLVPATTAYDGGRLFTRAAGRRTATPMLLVLVAIATTDVLFAVDSIPAVFAVTREPFLVFTSNAFALIGLRSLYFLIAGAVARLRYLHHGLAAILIYVGTKMLVEDVVTVPVWVSLLAIAGVLAGTTAASLARPAPGRPGRALPRGPVSRSTAGADQPGA